MKISLLQYITYPIQRLERPVVLSAAAWLLTMIFIPILGWTLGEIGVRYGTIAGVTLQVITVILALRSTWSNPKLIKVLIFAVVFAWLAEALGSMTGFPFGVYQYTGALQPQLAGVPLLIPFAWLMMLPPSWAVARVLTSPGNRWRFAVLSAGAMTAWDLFLDPQMVAWGYWTWHKEGIYFGIPLQNFFGWLLVSFLISLLVNPDEMNNNLLITIYILTWMLESFGLAFFWALPGPALAGFIGMGIFSVTAVARALRRPPPLHATTTPQSPSRR